MSTQSPNGLAAVVRAVKLFWAVFLLILVLLLMPSLSSASPKLYSFKMVAQDSLTLHFDLDEVVEDINMFTLAEPHRLVVDLPATSLGTRLPDENFDSGVVKRIRYAQHNEGYLRIVLDLRRTVSPTLHIVPRENGQRLVINTGVPADSSLSDSEPEEALAQPLRDVVIAIDAGHGGRDPGP